MKKVDSLTSDYVNKIIKGGRVFCFPVPSSLKEANIAELSEKVSSVSYCNLKN
jgi:hypothetical protein